MCHCRLFHDAATKCGWHSKSKVINAIGCTFLSFFQAKYIITFRASLILTHIKGMIPLLVFLSISDPRLFQKGRPKWRKPVGSSQYTRSDMTEMWLRSLVDMYCDVQPDCGDIHLPFGQMKQVYDLYVRCVRLDLCIW